MQNNYWPNSWKPNKVFAVYNKSKDKNKKLYCQDFDRIGIVYTESWDLILKGKEETIPITPSFVITASKARE